jgi:outer membrane lipoprotein-sorting protein
MLMAGFTGSAQTAADLILKVKAKLATVNDYEARGKIKTNVLFLKAPVASVKVYYKKPDRLKIVNENGISLIPKGAVNINLAKVLSNIGDYELVDAGKETGSGFSIIKLLPNNENSEIVLSTLYIDEKNELIRKAKNTTRENGTYEMELSYGQYAAYGLPDKVILSFNTREYKLPKGVTFDYNTGGKKDAIDSVKNKKGKVEISYSSYIINKGVNDSVFSEK